MIQRIQTIYLFVAAIALALVLFFPIWTADTLPEIKPIKHLVLDATQLNTSIDENSQSSSTIYIAAIALLGAINALFTIFQFKKRKLQIKLGMLNILLISGLIASMVLAINKGQQYVGTTAKEQFGIAMFLPAIALICTLLANRAIKKDEALVRSVDRLR